MGKGTVIIYQDKNGKLGETAKNNWYTGKIDRTNYSFVESYNSNTDNEWRAWFLDNWHKNKSNNANKN